MELTIDETILNAYGFTKDNIKIQQIVSGHINSTYLLTNLENNETYILQSINANVFQNPETIATNIRLVADYLETRFPNYLFPAPLRNVEGKTMVENNGE